MKVAIVYNKKTIDENDVIHVFGMSTKEHYSSKTVEKVAKALEKGEVPINTSFKGGHIAQTYRNNPFHGSKLR